LRHFDPDVVVKVLEVDVISVPGTRLVDTRLISTKGCLDRMEIQTKLSQSDDRKISPGSMNNDVDVDRGV